MSELFDALVSLEGSLASCNRPSAILGSVIDHLPSLLPCRQRALATIDEESLLPVLVQATAGDEQRFQVLLEGAVAKGLFALALRRGQCVIDELPGHEVLVLQACATPTHLAGLILGICKAEAAQADRLAAVALAAARAGAAHENLALSSRILAHAQELEHAVQERTRDLASARDRAEAASRSKSSFLATVSHELRTPLNGIIGMAELIHADETSPARRDRLSVVRSCAEDLLRQIDGILDLSRIEAGRLDLAPSETDPAAVAMSVLRTLAPRAEGKGIELAWLPARGFPAKAVVDSGRLRQVLMNLAGNAVKFTEVGSVSIRGEAAALPAGGWRLAFHVVDTGPGIATDAQARLFTPFEQGDASINRRFGGSGLGLSISLRLCEAMGGGIELASEPGRGSTFTATLQAGAAASSTQTLISGSATVAVAGLLGESVRLGLERCGLGVLRSGPGDLLVVDGDDPAVAQAVAELPAQHPILILSPLARTPPAVSAVGGRPYRLIAKPPDPEDMAAAIRELLSSNRSQQRERRSPSTALPAIALAGSRILYADDQHVNRLVIAGQLKRLGIDAELATGGAEAVELALGDTWDLILLDCQMPEVDGFTAAARIRERGCRTPLVAVTAHAMAGDREECLLRGFDDYLAKPVRPTELAATLARWIHAERDAPAAPPPPPPARLAGLREEVGEEVLREVIQAMLAEGPRLAGEASAACSAGDLVLAGRRAHALKGDAGNLGLDDVASLAKALEMAARAGDRTAASAAAARLPEAWRLAETSLRKALSPEHA